jgi:hypothetical protein
MDAMQVLMSLGTNNHLYRHCSVQYTYLLHKINEVIIFYLLLLSINQNINEEQWVFLSSKHEENNRLIDWCFTPTLA